MLVQLEISNIALIDKVNIELGKSLNILTGETGAGKSIIIDSINAILGERVSKELIRSGKEKASVEAVFQIDYNRLGDIFEEMGIEAEEDGMLVLSREFSVSGKNVCRINGKMVTVSMLKQIGERLVDIHGQHDNQSLLRVESHLDFLDSFGGEKVLELLQQYRSLLDKYKELRSRLKSLAGDRGERERRKDLLAYQIEEIKKGKLKSGEEEDLGRQRAILANSEKIIGALSKAYDLLNSGSEMRLSAIDGINEAANEFRNITRYDDKYEDLSKKIEEIGYQLGDLIEEVRRERDNIEYNPDMLEHIEERMDLIYKLKKKYGSTVEEVVRYCESAEKELQDMVDNEENTNKLQEEMDKISAELYLLAGKLNKERLKAAELLETRIGTELEDLEMKKARFKANINFNELQEPDGERRFGPRGLDTVEFLISPNVGEPLKPLSKIASGGEMSRIMLAIKTILANVDHVPTLIFDEIDIGVSGRAAQKVGEKLSYISRNHQVICVTHLAQIASMADDHYLIEKTTNGENTETSVKQLDKKGVRIEIARILGGASISEITMKHAEEMLVNAQSFKTGK